MIMDKIIAARPTVASMTACGFKSGDDKPTARCNAARNTSHPIFSTLPRQSGWGWGGCGGSSGHRHSVIGLNPRESLSATKRPCSGGLREASLPGKKASHVQK